MKKSFLHVAILLIFSISWGSAYALDDGYNAHEVDAVQSDALVSLYDKSTAAIDLDSSGGAVSANPISNADYTGLYAIEPNTYKSSNFVAAEFSSRNVEQIDYGSWQYQS